MGRSGTKRDLTTDFVKKIFMDLYVYENINKFNWLPQ